MARPEYIEKRKRDLMFKGTLADSVNGVRDHAILRLLFGSFIRPVEMIRLKAGFFANEKGIVLPNETLVIPPEISFNGKERPMPIMDSVLIESIQLWINVRLENGWGVTSSGFLDLTTPLFMSKKDVGFTISTKRLGDITKHNCDGLNRHIRKRMKMAGIAGSVDSAARTLTLDLHRSGKSTKALWILRGDAQLSTTVEICRKDPIRFAAIVEHVY
jgi:integrase